MNLQNMTPLQQDKLILTKAYYNRGNAYAKKAIISENLYRVIGFDETTYLTGKP